MTKFLKVLFFSLVLCFSVSSFSFAASSSTSVTVPYCEPSTGPTTGYLTVYTDDGRTYTYTWSFYGATDSIAFTQGGLTVGVVDGGDKLLIRLVEMDATNTVYGTLISYGGGGATVHHSGAVSVSQSITVNPTGNITHYYLSGYVGSLSTDFNNFGRLDITWGNQDYSSQLTSILSSVNKVVTNTSLTYDKLDLLYTLVQNNYEDFTEIWSSMMSSIDNNLYETSFDVNAIFNIIDKWDNERLDSSVEDVPSDSVTDLEGSQSAIRDDSNIEDDIGIITDGFDFSNFGRSFGVVWSLCESILLSHSALMSLLFLVLALGVVNLILSRR